MAQDWSRTFPGDVGELSPQYEHRWLLMLSGGSPLESKDTVTVDAQISQKPAEMHSRDPRTLCKDEHLRTVFKA